MKFQEFIGKVEHLKDQLPEDNDILYEETGPRSDKVNRQNNGPRIEKENQRKPDIDSTQRDQERIY